MKAFYLSLFVKSGNNHNIAIWYINKSDVKLFKSVRVNQIHISITPFKNIYSYSGRKIIKNIILNTQK